jgi:hypothetical protein
MFELTRARSWARQTRMTFASHCRNDRISLA